ncbi:MAG: type I-B CRISPR-associated protein Cas7/Cst2/DevR [Christensenellales bacterium]
MNKKSGLTITMIFKAQSLNYSEGIGNIAELKKLTRGNGDVYTFASRQALRYDIARLGNEMFNWNLQVVDKDKKTVQFSDKYTIEDSEEMDLFGYMRTIGKSDDKDGGANVRSAVVRLSNAISLEKYKSDIEFLSNKGMADRIKEHPNIANLEQHLSYYTYTVTIDLSKVGIDCDIELSNEVKKNRVIQLLEILKVLNRNIRGREENLSPVFVIGGIYKLNSPFFLGRIALNDKKEKFELDVDMLKDAMSLKLGEEFIKDDTRVGIVKNTFSNEDKINEMVDNKVGTVQEFFEDIESKVSEYYM